MKKSKTPKKPPNYGLTDKEFALALLSVVFIQCVCIPALAFFILQWVSPVDLLLIGLAIVSAVFGLLALFGD